MKKIFTIEGRGAFSKSAQVIGVATSEAGAWIVADAVAERRGGDYSVAIEEWTTNENGFFQRSSVILKTYEGAAAD